MQTYNIVLCFFVCWVCCIYHKPTIQVASDNKLVCLSDLPLRLHDFEIYYHRLLRVILQFNRNLVGGWLFCIQNLSMFCQCGGLNEHFMWVHRGAKLILAREINLIYSIVSPESDEFLQPSECGNNYSLSHWLWLGRLAALNFGCCIRWNILMGVVVVITELRWTKHTCMPKGLLATWTLRA